MTLIRLSKAACYTSPTRVATCGCDCWLIFNFSLEVSLGFVLCNVNSECCSRQEHWPEGTQGREWQVGRVTDRRFQVRDQNQSSQRPYPHVTSCPSPPSTVLAGSYLRNPFAFFWCVHFSTAMLAFRSKQQHEILHCFLKTSKNHVKTKPDDARTQGGTTEGGHDAAEAQMGGSFWGEDGQ